MAWTLHRHFSLIRLVSDFEITFLEFTHIGLVNAPDNTMSNSGQYLIRAMSDQQAPLILRTNHSPLMQSRDPAAHVTIRLSLRWVFLYCLITVFGKINLTALQLKANFYMAT